MSLRRIHRKPLKESKKFSVSRKSRKLNEFNFASDYDEDLSENPGMLFDLFKEYLEETLDGDIPTEQGSILQNDNDFLSCKIYLSKIKNACELFMKKYLPDYSEKIYYRGEGKDYIKVDLGNLDDPMPYLDADFKDDEYFEDREGYPVYGEAFGWYRLSDYLEMEAPYSHPFYECLRKTWIKIQGTVTGEIAKGNVSKNEADFIHAGENYIFFMLDMNPDEIELDFD